MRGKESDLFHVVFSKMHASADNGSKVDREMLVDMAQSIFWHTFQGERFLRSGENPMVKKLE
jgi:hypothetical protein